MLDQIGHDVDLADATEAVAGAWERGWTVPPRMTVSQYADAYRHIAVGAGAEPGKWRTSRNPPQREIQDALSEHSPVQLVDLMKPVQWGATEIGINFVAYVIGRGLDSMIVAQPVKDLARSWATAKFGPAVALMPDLQACITLDNTLEKAYAGGTLWTIWCNSPNQLRQRTARFIFSDEVDEYPDDLDGQGPADEQLAARAMSFGDRGKNYRACTPTVAGRSKIEKGYQAGDQRIYMLRCPECLGHHELTIERLTPQGTFACPHCGIEIHEHQKTRMLVERSPCSTCGDVPVRHIHHTEGRKLVYSDECACGEVVDPPAPDGAYWMPRNPAAPRTHRSYHIWAAYTPVGLGLSWAEIARRRELSENDPAARIPFTNLILARPHEGVRNEQDADEVATLAEPGRQRGIVPPGGLILNAGVDFQHDRAEIQVIAKGRGQRTQVVDYAVVECDPSRPDGYNDVDDYLRGVWHNHRGIPMHITAVALDGGNWTETVAQYIKGKVGFSGHSRMIEVGDQHRRQSLYLVRGRAERRSDRAVYRPRKTEVNHREKTIARAVGVWGVGTSVLKHLIYGWISSALQKRQEADAAGEPDPIEQRMIRWPGGRGEPHDPLQPDPGAFPPSYWKGLTCEYFDLDAGQWITPRGARNEPLDTLVYAEWAALSPAVKVDMIREPQWQQLEAQFEPEIDLFNAPAAPAVEPEPASEPVPPPDPDGGGFGSESWGQRW